MEGIFEDGIFMEDIVICGAGIAGIAAAYHLAVRHRLRQVVLVDERPPLSLTSDKSTECYRNWWPGPDDAMVRLMNRSIDLLEALADESGNTFQLNRRGYLYLTADPQRVKAFVEAAQQPSHLGAGELRVHRGQPDDPVYLPAAADGYHGPDGADLFLEPALIHRAFPYVSSQVLAALHVRRAGWFSAQQLGRYLLEQARAHGARLVNGRVSQVEVKSNQVKSVVLADGKRIPAGVFVNAAGPMLKPVAALLGLDLLVYSELHLKVAYKDPHRVVPRDAPLLIWSDPQRLPWGEDERALLAADQDLAWLLEALPPGVHTRPEGGPDSDIVLMLWEYQSHRLEPIFPPPLDEMYPEVVLRGLAAMLPGIRAYFGRTARPYLDGGYYTRTLENRPLVGPLPVGGTYVLGALSGFGLMAACAAGELLAAHVTGAALPDYAPAFSPARFADPSYQAKLQNWGTTGQL
jgi:glycine/D-amino acid oxidase-like deaminating enzyme